MQPLRNIEAELIEESKDTISSQQTAFRQKEKRLAKLEKRAAEHNDEHERHEAGEEAKQVAAELAREVYPAFPKITCKNVTSEKLELLLMQQNGRIGMFSAEAGPFDVMGGRYSSGAPNYGVFLEAHAGDDLDTSRMSRTDIRVESPALTCLVMLQPGALKAIAANQHMRARGLLARWGYVYPQSRVGNRRVSNAEIDESLTDKYEAAIRRLFEIPKGVTLTLDREADHLFTAWRMTNEASLGPGGSMEYFTDWGSKAAGLAMRIAALFHCLDAHHEQPIESDTVERSLAVVEYLTPHAEYVLGEMSAYESGLIIDCNYVLDWIQKQKPDTFTRRDVWRSSRRKFDRPDSMELAFDELCERNYIARCEGNTTSRPFIVNPAVFGRSRLGSQGR